MKIDNAALTLAIIEKLLIYGPTVIVQIADAFENEEPTAADIRSLMIAKEPEEYF